MEGQEWSATRDDGSKIFIPLVQPPKNIEDKDVVRDSGAEDGQGVSHALHLATIVAH
jgi:hypothetical protein